MRRNTITPTVTNPPEKLASMKTLCQLTELSSRTLRRLSQRGLIPAPIHIGRSVRWDVGAVMKALQAGQR